MVDYEHIYKMESESLELLQNELKEIQKMLKYAEEEEQRESEAIGILSQIKSELDELKQTVTGIIEEVNFLIANKQQNFDSQEQSVGRLSSIHQTINQCESKIPALENQINVIKELESREQKLAKGMENDLHKIKDFLGKAKNKLNLN